ncbi:hypothetical protein [Salinarimonas soli]|uniref:Anti-sigma factor NepR domain-containing protein n=1 Tax=Salinarimonas soli TaxID=1638099 RepID=A0A5B2VF55_9HYPH|nr:hypothetical protein [Salinarimonas soli]KAA2237574.1 hypothetical protein F0L46_11370 [Salinarimonas soli]
MPDESNAPTRARIERRTQTRIGYLLRTLHMPPEGSPIPDDQVDLLLALRRKERERRREA